MPTIRVPGKRGNISVGADPEDEIPLEEPRTLSHETEIDDQRVVAEVEASWASISISALEPAPIRGISAWWDGRGFPMAVACSKKPEMRMLLHRKLTERARTHVERVLSDAMRAYKGLIASPHLLLAWRFIEAMEALKLLPDPEVLAKPNPEERAALRSAFKRGEMGEDEYKARRRVIRSRDHDRKRAVERLWDLTDRDFAEESRDSLGIAIPLAWALRFYREPAVREQLNREERDRIETHLADPPELSAPERR
jgi:hypothetical protein